MVRSEASPPSSFSQETNSAQARNAEKSQSMLFRFRASQAAELGIVDLGRTRRPKAPSTVDTVAMAERWRGQVVTEISRKVTKIHDSTLSDYQIRDLNDDINKLMKEKWSWERRIRDLGGPNYARGGAGLMLDDQGREVPGANKGYRYFGRARELPGVKEAFEAEAQRALEEREGARGGGGDLRSKIVDAAYYGWNNDERDGTMLAAEATHDKKVREALLQQADPGPNETPDWEDLPGDSGDGRRWNVPTVEEVQEELLDRRRRRLLDKLGS